MRKLFATKILLSGKFSLFVTLMNSTLGSIVPLAMFLQRTRFSLSRNVCSCTIVGCCRIHIFFSRPRSGSIKIFNGGVPESPTLFIQIATLDNNSDLITNTSISNQIMLHFAFWATRHTWRHSIILNLNIVDNLQSSVLAQSVALCSPPLMFVPIDPTQSAFICFFFAIGYLGPYVLKGKSNCKYVVKHKQGVFIGPKTNQCNDCVLLSLAH